MGAADWQRLVRFEGRELPGASVLCGMLQLSDLPNSSLLGTANSTYLDGETTRSKPCASCGAFGGWKANSLAMQAADCLSVNRSPATAPRLLLRRQWYTDVPKNLRVENGKLVLQVLPQLALLQHLEKDCG